MMASREGRLATVELLVKAGADMDAKDKVPTWDEENTHRRV